MTTERDTHFMGLAMAQAQAAAAAGETPVGAVIVDPETDAVIAAAGNAPISSQDPTGHAEVRALRLAAQKTANYRLTGLELFVTLEPCAMCAGAISHARIGRVVFGASDTKGGAVDHGPRFFEQPTCHWRPRVTGGVMAEEAGGLLKSFFRAKRGKSGNAPN
jgi:tRNA(adenine34) deaminase